MMKVVCLIVGKLFAIFLLPILAREENHHRKLIRMPEGEALPGSYVVVFDDEMDAEGKADALRQGGFEVAHTYTNVFRGVALRDVESQELETLLEDPEVVHVSEVSAFEFPARVWLYRHSI
jgi:hypothetical protein